MPPKPCSRLAELFGRDNTFVELQHNLVHGDTRRMRRSGSSSRVRTSCNRGDRQRALPPALAPPPAGRDGRDQAPPDAGVLASRCVDPTASFSCARPQRRGRAICRRCPRPSPTPTRSPSAAPAFNLANHRDLGYNFPDFTRKEGEQESSADEVLAAFCARRIRRALPTRPDRRRAPAPKPGNSSTTSCNWSASTTWPASS